MVEDAAQGPGHGLGVTKWMEAQYLPSADYNSANTLSFVTSTFMYPTIRLYTLEAFH